jgi:putative protease
VFNRGFSEGQFSNSSKRSIRPGHVGLEIGKVISSKKNQIAIKLDDSIQSIPEKGDGILIVKDDNDYGLEISQNPIVTTLNHFKKGKNKPIKDMARKDRVLIVKKVWQNRKSDFDLKGSDVYLTKRHVLSKKAKEIENKAASYVKSKLILTFSIKNRFPKLKGRLTLANKKEVECEVTGNSPFEKPLKKCVDQDTIKRQLSKVDNYPFQIIQINVNYDGTLFIPISKINQLRRDLFEKLEKEVANLYSHDYKKVALKHEENQTCNVEPCISFYTNNPNHLKILDGVKRVYLEIPPQDDSLDITSNADYNLNYMVSFLKEAYEISRDKNYELIWKWPDIAHDRLIKALNRVRGILNKMHYDIPIMSNSFNGEYGPYSMNITNTESIDSLESYRIITLSPELRKRDYEEIISHSKNPDKIEMMVQGSVELMKTRYPLLYNKELKAQYKNCLIDLKGNSHPIHKSISGEELIIFSDRELSLIDEINHLKSIGFSNFSIDGRYKGDDYCKMVEIYNKALDNEIRKNELVKISPKNMMGNY